MPHAVTDALEGEFQRAAALVNDGRYRAAADLILAAWRQSRRDVAVALRCIQPLLDLRCRDTAGVVCGEALAGVRDPELLRVAAQLARESGDFEAAQSYTREAIPQLPQDGGLLQLLAITRRHTDADDADIRHLEEFWNDGALPRGERELAGFALGKCYDDIGNYFAAAKAWQQANAWAAESTAWNTRHWLGFVDFTLQLRPPPIVTPADLEVVPVFIVGLPRTGTSLVADLLGRFPDVRNRGEMNWIWFLWDRLKAARALTQPAALAEAARLYLRHLRRDDAPARWYIDKNPLNIRSLPLIDALFPNARIIHCRRDLRDTALSIWSQFFATGESDYAYRFEDIAAFAAGCERIAQGVRPRLRLPVFELSYESLAEDPRAAVRALAGFLGLPEQLDPLALPSTQAISTASAWQARQPVYRSSIGRWQRYAPFIPQLSTMFS